MADLSDRGQMILIAGFALAVTFVALALVVNSAIFTENLASRGETGGSENALHLRHEVATSVGESIRYANVHNTSSQTELREAVDDGTDNTTRSIERQHATHGGFVNVSWDETDSSTYEMGSRVVQNDSSTFENPSGIGSWTVVGDVTRNPDENGTRAFKMNITKSSLSPSSTGAFTVKVEKYDETDPDPDSYDVLVYKDGALSNDIVVEVDKPNSGDESCTKTVDDQSYVRIHLTRGLVAGKPCDALRQQTDLTASPPSSENFRFAAGVGTNYNISFENGALAQGNYSLVTTNTSISNSNHLNYGAGSNSPFGTEAMYSAVVEYQYDSQKLHYESDVRVAPEENP